MDPGAPPPKNKLPFKRRTVRKAAEPGGEDSLSLFKRSAEIMPKVVAEAEARAKRAEVSKEKHRREREAAEKRAHDEVGDDDAGAEEMPNKRQSTDSELRRLHSPISSHGASSGISPSSQPATQSSNYNSPHLSQHDKNLLSPPPLSNIVEILDPDSDIDSEPKPSTNNDESIQVATVPDSPPPVTKDIGILPHEPTPEVSDPELQKYIEEARRARLRREELAQAETSQNLDNDTPGLTTFTPLRPKKVKALTTVIISHIPGTTDIPGFHLPVDKPLEELQQSWIDQQALHGTPIADKDDLVLTWRGNETYSTTTLQSLNIGSALGDVSDSSRRMYSRSDSQSNSGFSTNKQRVVFEIWTHALLNQDRERKARMALMGIDDDDDNGLGGGSADGGRGASQPVDEENEPQAKIRLTLQSKDGQTAKLSATPETEISTLVQAFIRKNTVPAGMRVEIRFDGLPLAEGSTLEETEVEDRDTMEVHYVPA